MWWTVGPESAAVVEGTHETGVARRDGVVVIVHEQAKSVVVRRGAAWERFVPGGLTRGSRGPLEVLLETGDDLLEGLFGEGAGTDVGVEVRLVDAFGEQAGETPAGDGAGDGVDGPPTLVQGEVDVGFGGLEEFFVAFVLGVVALSREAAEAGRPLAGSELPSSFVVEAVEVGYVGLFGVASEHPGGVELGVLETVRREGEAYLAVGIAPMPDRDGNSRQDEMRGLGRRGTGGAGFVNVAKIQTKT